MANTTRNDTADSRAANKFYNSSDYKTRTKNSIESLITYSLNCRGNALKRSDMRSIAKYFGTPGFVDRSNNTSAKSATPTPKNNEVHT